VNRVNEIVEQEQKQEQEQENEQGRQKN